MTAKLIAQPKNLLCEDFNAEDMHPADIEQLLTAAYEEYQSIPAYTKFKKLYRNAYNKLVDLLTEKRGFMQYSHL